MYRLVVKKCNIILDIERNKLPTTSSKHLIQWNAFSIKGTTAIYANIAIKGIMTVSLRFDV